MKLPLYIEKISVTALAMMFSALSANASPITVPNGSFETPTSPTQTSNNPNIVSGWVFGVQGGSAYGTRAISSNFTSGGSSSGNDYAFINNDSPNVTDTITSAASLGTIAPLTTYTLTLAIGNEKGSDSSPYGAPGNVSFSLLANGVAFATETVSNGTVPNGTFEDFTLTYTIPTTSPLNGENLTIQLATLPEQGTAYQPAFDNVRLDATAQPVVQVIPEPATGALLVSGVLALVWVARRRRPSGKLKRRRRRSLFYPPILTLLSVGLAQAEAIKTFPLDDHTVYHLKVATDKVTTIVFPQVITDIESSGITADPKVKANILMSYHAGDRFFSVRAVKEDVQADLNVICNRSVYILELATDKEPFQSVRFYPADESTAATPGFLPRGQSSGPNHLFGLLDKAKAFPLLAEQYPEMVSQIDQDEPDSQTLYRGFDVILAKVFRFDPEDTLIFQIELVNHTDQPIYYIPQSLGVRVGPTVYWSALSDASGIMPPGEKDPKTGTVTDGHSIAWFVICGTSEGGRNHLAVQNKFNVLVFRPQPRETL
jgi:hypothetical protein